MRYARGMNKDQLFGQLLDSVNLKFGHESEKCPASLGEWAERTPVILDGRPFSFKRHEYLITPYADQHPNITFIKAAQLGLTTLAMLRAMYAARYREFRGILYLFPSKTDVTEFAKGRIDPLMRRTPTPWGSGYRIPTRPISNKSGTASCIFGACDHGLV